jgi:hypothetical protein
MQLVVLLLFPNNLWLVVGIGGCGERFGVQWKTLGHLQNEYLAWLVFRKVYSEAPAVFGLSAKVQVEFRNQDAFAHLNKMYFHLFMWDFWLSIIYEWETDKQNGLTRERLGVREPFGPAT